MSKELQESLKKLKACFTSDREIGVQMRTFADEMPKFLDLLVKENQEHIPYFESKIWFELFMQMEGMARAVGTSYIKCTYNSTDGAKFELLTEGMIRSSP